MARLTWQNVGAPDFGNAMYGFRAASGMLNNALQGIQAGIGGFVGDQKQQAENAVLARALQFTDANNYENALRSGDLYNGIDPTQLSTQALSTLAGRSGDLLRNDATRQNMQQNQYTFGRQQSQDTATDNARGAIGQLLSTGLVGGNVGGVYGANEALLSQLTPDQLAGVLNSASSLGSSYNRDRLAQANHALSVQRENRASEAHRANMTKAQLDDAYANAYYNMQANTVDNASAQDWISQQDLPASVKNRLVADSKAIYGSTTSTGSRSGSSSGAVADALTPYQMQQAALEGAEADEIGLANTRQIAFADNFAKASRDNTPAPEVKDKLFGKGGPLASVGNEGRQLLDRIMTSHNLTASAAGEIIKNAQRTEQGALWGTNEVIDQGILNETLRNVSGYGPSGQKTVTGDLVTNRQYENLPELLKGTRKATADAEAALTRATETAKNSPFMEAQLPRLREALEDARAAEAQAEAQFQQAAKTTTHANVVELPPILPQWVGITPRR